MDRYRMAQPRQARRPQGRPLAVSALALAMALAACAQKAGYTAPHFPFFGSYSGRQAAPVLLSNAEWWHGFQDPVLDQLAAEALAANLTIAGAKERVIEARAQERGVPDRAALSASATGKQQGEAGSGVTSTTEGDLGFSWMLDPYGERRARKAAAAARVEAADAETDAGTAVLPPRGVRCHCASFPVSGMVTDGPSCGNRRSIWSTVMLAVHALIDLVRVCCAEVSLS